MTDDERAATCPVRTIHEVAEATSQEQSITSSDGRIIIEGAPTMALECARGHHKKEKKKKKMSLNRSNQSDRDQMDDKIRTQLPDTVIVDREQKQVKEVAMKWWSKQCWPTQTPAVIKTNEKNGKSSQPNDGRRKAIFDWRAV